tara:strand:- start:80 stop:517 length:438 start_codon:yes stop_codon:yes gene_type:complete
MDTNTDLQEMDFPFISPEDTDSARSIWMAVIIQQIADARSTSLNPRKAKLRREALEWLDGTEGDFIDVCRLAELEPSATRRRIDELLRSPGEPCDFRSLRRMPDSGNTSSNALKTPEALIVSKVSSIEVVNARESLNRVSCAHGG